MAENSKIQWTTHTFNPWRGCTKVSPGCANCYAEAMSLRNPGTLGVWGPSGTRIVAAEDMWKEPLRWNAAAKKSQNFWACGGGPDKGPRPERPRVFCASLADVFENWTGPLHASSGERMIQSYQGDVWDTFDETVMPWEKYSDKQGYKPLDLDDVRVRLFTLPAATPYLDWLILTKRPENIARMMPAYFPGGYIAEAGRMNQESPRPNVWLGTSVEDQEQADSRIPHLLKNTAAVRFLSVEPLLGPVDLSRWLLIRWQCGKCHGYFSGSHQKVCPDCGKAGYWSGSHAFNGRGRPANDCFPYQSGHGIDWVIVGGESGPGARPCRLKWVSDIVRQCREAGVACFVKQLGSVVHDRYYSDFRAEWEAYGNEWPDALDWSSRDGQPPIVSMVRLPMRNKKGGDMNEWPDDLRVRQSPKG